MNSIKMLIAVLLLVMSGQSMALFMPSGSQAITESPVVNNDVGC